MNKLKKSVIGGGLRRRSSVLRFLQKVMPSMLAAVLFCISALISSQYGR
ncbi:hypothetical protein [Pantoea piersonii]|nr:hypothetical protein [Pantoea piersonii]MBZ6401901.1 hypothetical protein [Pantoea piersonii]MBZ6428717.1 hypothetical protein [Pantoea piersonii]WBV22834.1 hypothetical protein PG877_06680 [Pantoea piersonii]